MKFWQQFSKKSVIRQLVFVLILFAILIPLAIWDSNTQVKVTFGADSMSVRSDQYSMSIDYAQIASAQLSDLAEPGEKVQDGYDNDIIRTGVWKNDTWGEYYICVDLDASNCVVLQLNDDRIFVISRKDNQETAQVYEQLQAYLNN